jgi:cation diffusion facilitator CzcD-associated flavoprotein CzcO
MKVLGLGRRALEDVWGSAGARAYLGMAVPQFPNLFVMYGPNTNLGVGSIVYMLESQARYIRQAVQQLAERPGQVMAVRADVEQRFDQQLQKRLDKSPWNFCSSWYRNAAGRITNNWPGTVTQYRLRTRRLRLSDYTLTPTK